MSDPRIRNLKIKTGVVKRIAKEKVSYEKESDNQKSRIDKFVAAGEDELKIKKEREVLQESLSMIPDTQRRLVKAFEELKTLLTEIEDLKKTDDYLAAVSVIEDATPHLPID